MGTINEVASNMPVPSHLTSLKSYPPTYNNCNNARRLVESASMLMLYLAITLVNNRVYRSITKYTGACRSIPKCTEVYRSIPKYTEVYRSIPKYTEEYRSIPKYIEVYRSMPTYTEAYRCVPKYTRVPKGGYTTHIAHLLLSLHHDVPRDARSRACFAKLPLEVVCAVGTGRRHRYTLLGAANPSVASAG